MDDRNGHGGPPADLEQRRGQHTEPASQRSALRALVQDFGPIWFTWCMNSGILGILMHQLPYQFRGLGVISTVAFMVDLVLFAIFSTLFLARLAVYRCQAYDELTAEPNDLCILACWPIAWMTLVSFVTLTATEASWAGPGDRFALLAYVMWWIAAAWMLATLCFSFAVLIRRRTAAGDRLIPHTAFLPSVGMVTLATVGGLVGCYAQGLSARLAVPVIIASLCAVGVGLILATFQYALLFQQLLARGFPAQAHGCAVFLYIGPMGQGATAFQLLGAAAHTYGRFAAYNRGTFLTGAAAQALDVACILLALLLTAMGTVWLLLALVAMIDKACHGELIWAPTWNSIIFPTGTLATSLLLLSVEMDSPFFRVTCTILLVFMLVVYFVNLFFTLRGILQGKLLIVREDPRVKRALEEQVKTR